jgi:hypothetical protein
VRHPGRRGDLLDRRGIETPFGEQPQRVPLQRGTCAGPLSLTPVHTLMLVTNIKRAKSVYSKLQWVGS